MIRRSLAVVIPAKNEAAIIASTIEQVLAALDRCPVMAQVICVDDGSTDATWEILQVLARKDQRVVAVRLSRNFGHDFAVFAGLMLTKCDAAITMDADGQHPFDVLPLVIDRWLTTGCDIVNGIKRERGAESRQRALGVSLFSRFLSWSMQQDLTNATEFKLLGRKAIDALLACKDYHIFYRALVPWIGFRQESFEFDVAESMRGYSHWRFGALLRFALDGLVMFSDLPIKLILTFGLLTLGLASLLMLKLMLGLLFGSVPEGYSTLLTLMLMNLSCTMIGIGAIGFYVRTTLRQSLGRPRAIIEAVSTQDLASISDGRVL